MIIKPPLWNVLSGLVAWRWFWNGGPAFVAPFRDAVFERPDIGQFHIPATNNGVTSLQTEWGHTADFPNTENLALGNPDGLKITNHITLLAGVIPATDPDPGNNGGRIISRSDGGTSDDWALGCHYNGTTRLHQILFRAAGAYFNGPNDSYTPNVLSHFAGVYNGVDLRGYVNSVLVGSPVPNTAPIDTDYNIRIGRHGTSDAGRNYVGQILYLYVLPFAISAQRVAQIANDPFGPLRQGRQVPLALQYRHALRGRR